MATVSTTIELVDKITNQLNKIKDSVNDVEEALQGVGDQQDVIDGFSWSTFISNAEEAGKKMERIGKTMSLAVTTPLTLLGKKMYGNATEYESAFAGVKKTTDATEEEFAALYQDLLQISETNPTGFVEAAGIMEMAGQLGVAKDELTGFTNAYIGLQESTNIQGESGAADLARFLNVTEKTTDNVDRVGGVIVGLGNNFATTENEILSMATRMGATADLAGFSATEILAFSAALSSVGINAEAGGSAAGKLMKRMQLAAEVGGQAKQKLIDAGFREDMFESGLDFSNWLSIQKKEDLANLAWDLNMTTDAVQEMADSWLALDQFSEVMGVDQAGFLESWDQGAAQSMLRFFQGLGNLDPESGNSVLAQLAEMDLTEIRLSNLIAAMAGNSDLFQAALDEAYRQYSLDPGTNAMAEEVAKRYATQESQNEMLGNKMSNTMADFGQNLVEALQPALDMLNSMLDAFNKMSETDQTALIKTLGAIALLGPGLTIAGNAMQLIANGMQLAGKLKGGVAAAESAAAAGAPAAGGALGKLLSGITAAKVGVAAGFGYLFKKGADYREEYGAIGSVEAIANGTRQNEALQAAFVEMIESQAALNDMINNAGAYSEEEQNRIGEWATKASEAFYGFEDATNLMHLYSDWRQENGLSNMDWVVPEGLSEMLSSSMQTSGADVAQGLADGITGSTGVAQDAASSMGQSTVDAANSAMGVSSPSVIMYQAGLDVAQGLANGMHAGTGIVAAAARALGNATMTALRASLQVHSPSRLTYDVGDNTVQGLVNGIMDGRSAVRDAWSDIALFSGMENDSLLGKDIKMSDSDVRTIRDLAEREVVNRFTTAEVRVEMTNNNSISSEMDLDGIVDYLGDKLSERLEAVAEGVYA